jgi:type II pantothenate kinase
MIAGIDVGGTNTQGIILKGGKIERKAFAGGNSPEEVSRCFRELTEGIDKKRTGRLVLTGGAARKVKAKDVGMRFSVVDEIKAIGRGGVYLSGKRDVFVVSMGTGTAFVSVKRGAAKHLGGTGLGGGTVEGLSKVMLSMKPDGAERAAEGFRGLLDLSVKDIVGKGIGKIPADATAANFGKVRGKAGGKADRKEIAGSMFRMVAESVGVMSYFAAKSVGQEKSMLVCGRVPMNDIVKKRILYTIRMFGGKARVPKNAQYCAAIGAALS